MQLKRSILLIFLFTIVIGFGQQPIKIACVGNSITYGSGVFNREKNAYPAQLQNLLGKEYEVKNFGVSGRTLLKKGDYPYWKTDAYRNALDYNAHIVFIKLGTNDSKSQNRIYLDEFESNYIDLINSFKKENKRARIILLLPVPTFTTDTVAIWKKPIVQNIIPAIQRVAFKTNSEVLDLYHLFQGKEGLLPDKVHPSALGATIIAKRLYEAVVQSNESKIYFSQLSDIEPKKSDNFYGYPLQNFEFNNVSCKIVLPKRVAKGKPWVLRARFWGHEPQADIALLERGFHIAYCDVSNLFGGKEAIARWDAFYSLMTTAGLSKKVALEGMSRGGLIIYNWAEKNPEKVACVYADAPVLDGKSWPGGKNGKYSKSDWEKFKKIYGLKNAKKEAKFKDNPIHKTKNIANGGYPMLHVVGATDKVVPVAENTDLFAKMVKEEEGDIKIISKANIGHHPHSLQNPTPIVDFVLRATGQKVNFAVVPSPSAEYRSAAGWIKGKDWWAQAKDIDSLCQNSEKVDVLFIGNSITQGWGGNRPHITHYPGKKAVQTYFKNLKIVGGGISGDRTQHILWRLQNGKYEKANPLTVVLAIGVNNFDDNTASEIVEGVIDVVHLVRKKFSPQTKILFFGPLPTGMDPQSDRRKKYNEIHRHIKSLGELGNVFYHNTVGIFSNEKGELNSLYYSKDGIHLKPEGYMVWGKYIAKQLERK